MFRGGASVSGVPLVRITSQVRVRASRGPGVKEIVAVGGQAEFAPVDVMRRASIEELLGHVLAERFNVHLELGVDLGVGDDDVLALASEIDDLAISIRYAKDRKAFGKSIAEFGMIQHKLAEMAIRIFAAEFLQDAYDRMQNGERVTGPAARRYSAASMRSSRQRAA